MSSILKPWFTMWANVCIIFFLTVSGCYVNLGRYLCCQRFLERNCNEQSFSFRTLTFVVSLPLFTPPALRGPAWNQTCLLSKTFLSGGTTIRPAPPPPLPCAALKGFPSWRLSWWWGLSVYYWVFCSPNSLPRAPPPNTEPGTVAWKKIKRDLDAQTKCTFTEFKTRKHAQPSQVISCRRATSASRLPTEQRGSGSCKDQDSVFFFLQPLYAAHIQRIIKLEESGKCIFKTVYRFLSLIYWHVAQETFLLYRNWNNAFTHLCYRSKYNLEIFFVLQPSIQYFISLYSCVYGPHMSSMFTFLLTILTHCVKFGFWLVFKVPQKKCKGPYYILFSSPV